MPTTKRHEYRVTRTPDGGHVVDGPVRLTVLPDRADRCRVFRRNRLHMGRAPERITVAEIDGVFLYMDGDELTMTKKRDT